MLISTDCGYNEADLPSKFHYVPLSFKIVLTVVGRHFGSLLNSPILSVHTVFYIYIYILHPVYCFNWHCWDRRKNSPLASLRFAIMHFEYLYVILYPNHRSIYHCTTLYITISNTEGTQHNLNWQVQLFLPHIPLLFPIKFDLCEDIADVLFIYALWDNPQVPSGCHDLYVLNKNNKKSHCPFTCWRIL